MYFLLLSQHVFHIRFPVSDRWLHPISIPELYEMYELHHQGKPVSSASVFRSELKRWRSVLKIRQVGQHARCMTCTLTPYLLSLEVPPRSVTSQTEPGPAFLLGSRLSEWRRSCRSAADRAKVQKAKANHLAGVFADRSCARRLMLTSESSTRDDLRVPPEKGMLYISIDGMDQVSLLQQHPDSNLIQSISFWLNGTETRLLSSSKTIQIGRILAFCCSPELRRSTNVPETFLSPKNFRRHSAHPSTWWDVWSMGCARSTSYATMMFPRAQTPT